MIDVFGSLETTLDEVRVGIVRAAVRVDDLRVALDGPRPVVEAVVSDLQSRRIHSITLRKGEDGWIEVEGEEKSFSVCNRISRSFNDHREIVVDDDPVDDSSYREEGEVSLPTNRTGCGHPYR